MRNRLSRDSAGLYLVKIAGAGVGFVVQIVFARSLGVEGFGIYSMAFAWFSMLLLVARQGFDGAAVRFVPAYRVRGDWSLLRGYLRFARNTVTASSVSVAVFLAAFVWLWRPGPPDTTHYALGFAAATIPVFALSQLYESVLRGLRYVVTAPLFTTVVHPVCLLAVFETIRTFSGEAPSAATAMASYFVASAFCLVCLSTMYARKLPPQVRAAGETLRRHEWLRTSCAMILVTASSTLLNHICIVLIGSFEGSSAAGLYSAAVRITNLIQILLVSVTAAFSPLASELYAKGEIVQLRRTAKQATAMSFLSAAAIATCLAGFGPLVLRFFGSEFPAAYSPLMILLAGQMMFALAAPAMVLLNMTGHHKDCVIIMGLGTVASVATCAAVLAAGAGIEGAAASSTLTLTAIALALLQRTHRRLGIGTGSDSIPEADPRPRTAESAGPSTVLIFDSYHATAGGNQKYICMLLAAQGSHWRASLACPGEGWLTEEARATGAEVHVVPQSPLLDRGRDALQRAGLVDKARTTLAIAAYNVRFWRFLRRIRPDVLQCHSMRNVLMVGLAAKLARVPLVLFVKGEMLSPCLDRTAMALADRTIFLTRYLKPRRFAALFARRPDRFSLLRLGIRFDAVDAAESRVRARAPYGLSTSPDTIDFVFAGWLVEGKGVHVLIEAFARLAARHPDCRLLIAGTSNDDAYRARIEGLAEDAGLAGRVLFLGWRPDVLDVIAAADVYVLPSFSEGVPRSIVEAMALARPVVATDVGGVSELLDQGTCGLVVPPGDADALEAAMARFAVDAALRQAMGEAGRRRARSDYGFDAHLDGLYAVLDAVKR